MYDVILGSQTDNVRNYYGMLIPRLQRHINRVSRKVGSLQHEWSKLCLLLNVFYTNFGRIYTHLVFHECVCCAHRTSRVLGGVELPKM